MSICQKNQRLIPSLSLRIMFVSSVKEVRRHEMVLSDGSLISFGLGVWSTGVAPVPFIKALDLPKDRQQMAAPLSI